MSYMLYRSVISISVCLFFLMIRRPPRSTRTDTLFSLHDALPISQYGPISARVTGTTTSPQVLLRAPRPGVGVGLVDLEARVRGANGAYAVVATGGTNYGPLSADVLVRPGKIGRAHD